MQVTIGPSATKAAVGAVALLLPTGTHGPTRSAELIRVDPEETGRLTLRELAPGVSAGDVRDRTAAPVIIPAESAADAGVSAVDAAPGPGGPTGGRS